MAYREVAMWEILTVLRRLYGGANNSAIARATGHSRSTIRRYLRAAAELGWTLAHGTEPTEELAAEISRRLSPAHGREAGEVEQVLLPHRDQIRSWLKPDTNERRGLQLTKVHQLLARQGMRVPYSSLHRFAVKHCGLSEGHITVRMADSAPGEAAEVDFGRLGLVWDPASERRRTLWALVVVLTFSRHQYVHTTFSQQLREVIGGVEDAWLFFGGVTRRLVIDNLAAAVTRADRYDPIFQRTFDEYASYRGFIIDPAPVRQPTGKPRVERGVPYVRENFFRGEHWRDAEHVQSSVITWCLQTAGTRTHGTTRRCPLAVFENEERAALLPLVKERFEPPHWAKCTVHPDHHISFSKALYSVPTRFIGKKVWVRADTKLVRIYVEGELVKTHARQPAGGRSTDHDDYPQELTAYTLRDPQRIIRQALQHGAHIGRFAEALLSGTFPWAKLRQAQMLLRLGAKYGWPRLDAACRRALAFELINVRRVETILRQDLEQLDLLSTTETEARVIPLQPRFLRAADSFSHIQRKESES
jgi:transposase